MRPFFQRSSFQTLTSGGGALMQKPWRRLLLCLGALLVTLSLTLPVQANALLGQLSSGSGSSSYTLGWVELDGYDVFQVSAPSSAIGQRRQQIQENLQSVRAAYLQQESSAAKIAATETEGGQPQIYVNGQYLMTVTEEDTTLQGLTPAGFINRLEERVTETLVRARRQRQADYRRRQLILIAGVVLLCAIASAALAWGSGWLLKRTLRALGGPFDLDQLEEDPQKHLRRLRQRLLPICYLFIFGGVAIWALGRFPETRLLQQNLLSALQVPIIIAIVFVVAYVGIRITYAVVDQLAMTLVDDSGFSNQYSRRTRLRISTLSSVIKNVANFVWIALGFVLALYVTGVNLGWLLASVGIVGLAISLAAQNLIKGAVQGFFIILEDQFAIGDVVKIGDDAGIVENLNLRITQLRDTEGRLITIPTSDIARVANYSLHWSRADLKIPVHYNANIDHMLDITRQVGQEMQHDSRWGSLILEEPQVLGVDDFGDSAVIIRVWIKTQPMKQWDVSREYRRRLKQHLEDSQNEIPFPQRDVWLHPSEALQVALQNAWGDKEIEKNGKEPVAAKTDSQPRGVPSDEDADRTRDDGEAAGEDS